MHVSGVHADLGRCDLIAWPIWRVNDTHRNLGSAAVLRTVRGIWTSVRSFYESCTHIRLLCCRWIHRSQGLAVFICLFTYYFTCLWFCRNLFVNNISQKELRVDFYKHSSSGKTTVGKTKTNAKTVRDEDQDCIGQCETKWKHLSQPLLLRLWSRRLFQLVWTTAIHFCTVSPTTCSEVYRPFKMLRRIWLVVTSVLRFIEHITPVLRQLHWLPSRSEWILNWQCWCSKH